MLGTLSTQPHVVTPAELPTWRVILLAICVGGCGTIANFRGSQTGMPYRQVYGGVVFDAKYGLAALTDGTCGHGGVPGCAFEKGILFPYFWTADLALSAILDTLTLPVT